MKNQEAQAKLEDLARRFLYAEDNLRKAESEYNHAKCHKNNSEFRLAKAMTQSGPWQIVIDHMLYSVEKFEPIGPGYGNAEIATSGVKVDVGSHISCENEEKDE